MVLKNGHFDEYHCEECDKQYTVIGSKWCKLCKSSGNKQIDDYIEKNAKNQSIYGPVFELIPYNQFDNIKEIGRSNFTKICSAIWKDRDYYYNKEVTLKYSYNSQNRTEEFLNEV